MSVPGSHEARGVSGRERDEQIRARVNAATKGPWKKRTRESGPAHVVAGEPNEHRANFADYEITVADYTQAEDAEFIAHAREDVPFLLGRVAALETALAERAASWEAKAIEADAASDSYRGHDVEAAVSLARDANRARNRATELRELAALAEGSAAQEETNDG